MKIVDNPHAAYAQVADWRQRGLRVGLVPTMGALHAGHLSLVERAKAECDQAVATIFVNPTQFGPSEDFSRYPRTLDQDLELLRVAGCDLVFTPGVEHMYPPGSSTAVLPPAVSRGLEGQFRPTHFQGVATIVLKLFHILPATIAYFGQKDYQQCKVIQHMVDELNVPVRVQICPTVREDDGLAMSSRNRYLSAGERQRALCLWRALELARRLYQQQWQAGSLDIAGIEQQMHDELQASGADRIDYARIVDRETLDVPQGQHAQLVAIIAALVGSTRLIDNLLLEPPGA